VGVNKAGPPIAKQNLLTTILQPGARANIGNTQTRERREIGLARPVVGKYQAPGREGMEGGNRSGGLSGGASKEIPSLRDVVMCGNTNSYNKAHPTVKLTEKWERGGISDNQGGDREVHLGKVQLG